MKEVGERIGGLGEIRLAAGKRRRLWEVCGIVALLTVLGGSVAGLHFMHERQQRLDQNLVYALERYDT